MNTRTKIVSLAFVFGLLFWLIDGVVDFAFSDGGNFWEVLLTGIPPAEICTRGVAILLLTAFGAIISLVMNKAGFARNPLVVAS